MLRLKLFRSADSHDRATALWVEFVSCNDTWNGENKTKQIHRCFLCQYIILQFTAVKEGEGFRHYTDQKCKPILEKYTVNTANMRCLKLQWRVLHVGIHFVHSTQSVFALQSGHCHSLDPCHFKVFKNKLRGMWLNSINYVIPRSLISSYIPVVKPKTFLAY